MILTLDNIIEATKGILIQGCRNIKINNISTNSKDIKKKGLFVAIKGKRLDAHQFIPDAVKNGAIAVIVSEKVKLSEDISIILVKDTTVALGDISSFYRQKFNIPIIAITGSAGKTTTKELIAAVLKTKFKVLKNIKSENNQFGVPQTLFKLKSSHQVAVLELGTNQPGDIDYLAKIVRPNIAVFTNVGESHLEKLKKPIGVYREKINLLKYLDYKGVVIFNNDNEYLKRIAYLKHPKKKISYSIDTESNYKARKISSERTGVINFSVSNKEYFIKSFSKHNVYNTLIAIICGKLFNIDCEDIKKAVYKTDLITGRFETKKIKGISIINDAYNSNPISLRSAIETLSSIENKGRKILICADMLELGEKSKEIHYKIGRDIGKSRIDVVFCFGENAQYIAKGITSYKNTFEVFHFIDIEKLKVAVYDTIEVKDIVLVKGSRGMKMERVVDYILEELKKS